VVDVVAEHVQKSGVSVRLIHADMDDPELDRAELQRPGRGSDRREIVEHPTRGSMGSADTPTPSGAAVLGFMAITSPPGCR
jgi:hypothetical protein